MDATEFACLLSALQEKLCIHIDKDIIAYIYDIYLIDYYDKYTLFELIDLFYTKRIPISCELSKKALVKLIKDKKLGICDKQWYDKKSITHWCQYTYDWIPNIYSNNIREVPRMNVICIKNINTDIEICKDDVFKIDNAYYEILSILNGKIFIYRTRETNICENIYLDIGKFIKMIDDNDATIIQNNILYSVMLAKSI
jgi:hypothetical protein